MDAVSEVRLRNVATTSADVAIDGKVAGAVSINAKRDGSLAVWVAKNAKGEVIAADCPSRAMAIDAVVARRNAPKVAV